MRSGRGLAAALVSLLVACSSAPLPPLGARARIVPIPLGAPSSCDDGKGSSTPPRPLTDLEVRMRSDDPDLGACRALCLRALGPKEELVGCFRSASTGLNGCKEDCDAEKQKLQRALFCGPEGKHAADDPAAAHAAMPFVVEQGGTVVVCNLK